MNLIVGFLNLFILLGPLYVGQSRQHIQKQRHYFVNKGLSSQGYGFSNRHVWM